MLIMTQVQSIGVLGEDIACEFLRKNGFKILKRNYRKSWGEVDIIAEKSKVIRFVEVKTVSRESNIDGSREIEYRPEEMVHKAKLKRLARIASFYMNSIKSDKQYQIDVVGVILNHSKRVARCRLFEQVLGDDL